MSHRNHRNHRKLFASLAIALAALALKHRKLLAALAIGLIDYSIDGFEDVGGVEVYQEA